QARALRFLRTCRLEQLVRIGERRVGQQQIRIRDEVRELRVEARARLGTRQAGVRKLERRVGFQGRLVLRDGPVPELARFERDRARLGELDLVEANAFLGQQQTVARGLRARANRERRGEVLDR